MKKRMTPQQYIRSAIQSALAALDWTVEDEQILALERPKQEELGDLASTVAMNLARDVKSNPRAIADKIMQNINIDSYYIDKIEVAGPGFINFFLAPACLHQAVRDIVTEGETYGHSHWGEGKKIQLEFVSANPTGPLNIVSARAAAVGDVLSNCYQAAGFDAWREFYINDAGRQIRLLGASLSARYMTELGHAEAVPEEGYHGEYLHDLALDIIERDGDQYVKLTTEQRHTLFSQLALEHMLARQKASLKKYGVEYQLWFRESAIREQKGHEHVIKKLSKKNLVYEQDGATWFKSSEFGDEKDRVLITAGGEPTYFLIDIAYHENKYERGFQKIIDFWGPDHHGYIDRMRAALIALGHSKESFDVSIIQQVNLLRSGKTVKMSKRAGEIIEMDELVDEVGVNAARYYFIDRRISQPMDFDIDLAKKQSDENPVYYVQYAHARICNILRFAQEQGIPIPTEADTSLLNHPLELQVIKKLIEFPETITRVLQFTEPHRLSNYAQEVATVFHRFYHEHRVVTDDRPLTRARMMLARATRQVLANSFRLLGIAAPENM
ncbi:arginine--tRNA ligase [candidate division KSB1 bacterium]|nr:arginine--tRNA ligase [candidate division KSB1 bacterium]